MSGMSYRKCRDCPHCNWFYAMGGGLYFICKITGDVLEINECPKECKCECENCKHKYDPNLAGKHPFGHE